MKGFVTFLRQVTSQRSLGHQIFSWANSYNAATSLVLMEANPQGNQNMDNAGWRRQVERLTIKTHDVEMWKLCKVSTQTSWFPPGEVSWSQRRRRCSDFEDVCVCQECGTSKSSSHLIRSDNHFPFYLPPAIPFPPPPFCLPPRCPPLFFFVLFHFCFSKFPRHSKGH